MLEIRPAQLEALRPLCDRPFLRRVQGYLRQSWPEECADHSDELLLELIAFWIAEARRWGLTEEASLASFASLGLRYGADFSRHPAVAAALAAVARESSPDRAFTHIESRVQPEVWKELRARKAASPPPDSSRSRGSGYSGYSGS